MGHDEAVYTCDSEALSIGGWRGLLARVKEVLQGDEHTFALRYGWIAAFAAFGRKASLAGIVLAPLALGLLFGPWAVLLGATSPLLWQNGRRLLQDATVAAVVLLLAALVKGQHTDGVIVATLVLLTLKEAAILYLPAVLLFAPTWGNFGAMAIGGACWLASLPLLFGGLLPDLYRRATRHDGDYNKEEARGMPHRLLVDLMMVSPFVLLAFARSATSIELGIVAAGLVPLVLSPVRNARTLIAFDLIMRGVAATSLNPYAIVFCMAFDVWVAWRIRNVYDPTSANLLQQTCKDNSMQPYVAIEKPETPEKIAGLVVCVGETYAQTLEATLPRWLRTLDSVCVVTSPDDEATLQVLDDYACDKLTVYKTDAFYRHGAAFNKALAMSEAVYAGAVDASGWLLTFDADVLPPLEWRNDLCLDRRKVYGTERIAIDSYTNFFDQKVIAGDRLTNKGNVPIGAFMLFWGKAPQANQSPMFPIHWPTAGAYDTEFVLRWDEPLRELLPFTVSHYGPHGENWAGTGKTMDDFLKHWLDLQHTELRKIDVAWPPPKA